MQQVSTPSQTRTNKAWIGAVLLLLAAACLYLAFPNARLDLTRFNCDDSEAYIGLANSIATGRPYTRCLNPNQYLPHKTWPPGLPLLIAPSIRLFGLDLLAMKLTVVLIGLVGLVFFYLLVRDLTDRPLATCMTAAAAGSAHYIWFSHQIMSEVPMFAVSVTALWMIQRAVGEPRRWRWWLLAGLVIGFGGIVKGLSILLVPGPLVGLLLINKAERRAFLVRYAVFSVIAVAPLFAWAWRNSHIQAESVDAINQFRMLVQVHANDPKSPLITPRDLVRNVYENVFWGMIYNVPDQVVPLARLLRLRDYELGRWIGALLTFLVLIACAWTLRRQRWPLHLYLIAVLGLLSVFTTGGSARYLVPVAPLIGFLVVVAIRQSNGWARLGALRRAAVAVWMIAVAVDAGLAFHEQETRPYADPHWAEFVNIAQKARDCIPPNATVCVHNANGFTVVSGRQTWMIQPGVDFDLSAALLNGRISHVVVSRFTPARDEERSTWVRSHVERFEPVAGNTGYDIFRWKGGVLAQGSYTQNGSSAR